MTISGTPVTSNLYATVAQLKTRLSITDTTDDTTLGMNLDGICRAIDEHCGWRFWRDATATTRYYTAEHDDTLFIDPLVSVTSIATDTDGDGTYTTTWATTDYRLMPVNAAADNWPYTWIKIKSGGSYDFVSYDAGVRIVGVFGWPAVPSQVTEAALLLSEQLYKRKDAIFGVMSFPEAGEIRMLIDKDPHLRMLLAPFVRMF